MPPEAGVEPAAQSPIRAGRSLAVKVAVRRQSQPGAERRSRAQRARHWRRSPASARRFPALMTLDGRTWRLEDGIFLPPTKTAAAVGEPACRSWPRTARGCTSSPSCLAIGLHLRGTARDDGRVAPGGYASVRQAAHWPRRVTMKPTRRAGRGNTHTGCSFASVQPPSRTAPARSGSPMARAFARRVASTPLSACKRAS
jgi:hypothetical protein